MRLTLLRSYYYDRSFSIARGASDYHILTTCLQVILAVYQ